MCNFVVQGAVSDGHGEKYFEEQYNFVSLLNMSMVKDRFLKVNTNF